MDIRKICTIAIPFPGAKRPFEEGTKLGMWDFVLLEGDRIRIPPADIYIFAAWHSVYSQLLNLGSTCGVMWTSTAGEMDFEPVEQAYLRWLLGDPQISFIWFGDPSLAQAYPEKGFYAPYPFDVKGFEAKAPHVEKRNIATLFCPMGLKKNILNQLLAMKLVQRELELKLHTNFPVNVPGVDGYQVGGLDVEVHGWLPPEEYHRLVASAKVNLACSWAESFNYQVAEAALLGTISVTSRSVPIPGVRVEEPNSPIHIAEKILMCENPYYREDILKGMRYQLENNNLECKRILSERLALL